MFQLFAPDKLNVYIRDIEKINLKLTRCENTMHPPFNNYLAVSKILLQIYFNKINVRLASVL